MTEIITISYIEDDPEEVELVEIIGSRIRALGGLAILTPLRFDEDGHGGGETPTIDFPNGKILSGMSSANQLLDSQYIEEYVQLGVDRNRNLLEPHLLDEDPRPYIGRDERDDYVIPEF